MTAASSDRRRSVLLSVFGLWTLFVWATRIDNVLADEELVGLDRAVRLGLAISFTVVGVALLVVAWRTRRRPPTRLEAGVVWAGCAWTVLVWVTRSIQIPLAGHDAGFVIVHLVLAVVSIALAVPAARSTTMPPRHGTAGHRRAEADVTR
jgi:hypothetical protein